MNDGEISELHFCGSMSIQVRKVFGPKHYPAFN